MTRLLLLLGILPLLAVGQTPAGYLALAPQYVATVFNVGSASSFGTLTQYNNSTSALCASGTTCTVSSVSLSSGDAAVITSFMAGNNVVMLDNNVTIGATSEPCIKPDSWNTNFPTGGSTDQCVILNANAASPGTLTVNYDRASGGAFVNVRRVAVNGVVAPSIDAVNSYDVASSTSITNVPLNITGTNAFVVSAMGFGATSVNGSWTDTTAQTGGGMQAFSADQKNVSSVATPVWTGSSMSSPLGVVLSFGPTSSVPWGIEDNSAGANNTQPTGANLASSTFGIPQSSGNSSGSKWSYTVTDASNILKYSSGATGDGCSSASHALLNPAKRLLYGSVPASQTAGTTYPNASSLGLAWTGDGSTTTSNILFNLPGKNANQNLVQNTVSESVSFCTTVVAADTWSAAHFLQANTSDGFSVNVDIVANGSTLTLTCALGSSGTCMNGLNGSPSNLTISSGTWYKADVQMNAGQAAQSPSGTLTGGVAANITLPSGCQTNTNAPWYISTQGTPEFVLANSACSGGVVNVTPVNNHSAGYTIQPASTAQILNDSGTLLQTFYWSESSGTPIEGRIGLGGGGALPNTRKLYVDKWAWCVWNPGSVCPTTIVP